MDFPWKYIDSNIVTHSILFEWIKAPKKKPQDFLGLHVQIVVRSIATSRQLAGGFPNYVRRAICPGYQALEEALVVRNVSRDAPRGLWLAQADSSFQSCRRTRRCHHVGGRIPSRKPNRYPHQQASGQHVLQGIESLQSLEWTSNLCWISSTFQSPDGFPTTSLKPFQRCLSCLST